MNKMDSRKVRIERMEQASAALVEQAHVLCTADNRVCHRIRMNTAELLKRARRYAYTVAAVRRS